MRRRDFIKATAGFAFGWPHPANAQRAGKTRPIVGYLDRGSLLTSQYDRPAFVKRLSELGWSQGRTVAIEYRFAEGRSERVAEFATELVRFPVDVFMTSGDAVLAIKQVTTTIPIVFGVASDPVGSGLVASLARPGGNVTGLSIQVPDLAGKRLEFLRQVLPDLRRLGIIGNFGHSAVEASEAQAAARTLGLEVTLADIRAEDIEPAFVALRDRVDALYVCSDTLTNLARVQIATSALAARLPSTFPFRAFAAAGGLMSYGPNIVNMYRRAAELVDKILRGGKPADIPVEQPTKFDLVINLKTAKALGLTVPDKLVAFADEVIE